MIYGIFPGGFKPPHKGHLKIIENIIDKVDALYIIISKQPRLLIPPFDKKLYQLSKNQTNKIIQKYNSKKSQSTKQSTSQSTSQSPKQSNKKIIEQLIQENKIPAITANESYNIWNLYLTTLPKKKVDKIKIYISPMSSPIFFSFIMMSKKLKTDDTLFLIKSTKNMENKRFDMFKRLKGKIEEINIPQFKNFTSSKMREYISLKNKPKFIKFLPNKLSQQTKNNIYKQLTTKLPPITPV